MKDLDFLLRFKCGEVRQINAAEAKLKWPKLLASFCKKNPGFGLVFTNNTDTQDKPAPNKLRFRRKSMFATMSSDKTDNFGK